MYLDYLTDSNHECWVDHILYLWTLWFDKCKSSENIFWTPIILKSKIVNSETILIFEPELQSWTVSTMLAPRKSPITKLSHYTGILECHYADTDFNFSTLSRKHSLKNHNEPYYLPNFFQCSRKKLLIIPPFVLIRALTNEQPSIYKHLTRQPIFFGKISK